MKTAKTVLVTGATAGFGWAIAQRFVAEGHRVIAVGRRAEWLAELMAAVEPGDRARLWTGTLDVRDTAAIAGLAARLPEAFAQVDVLVNNAGLALGLGKAHEADLAQWDQMIATNVTGLAHMTRAFLPGMVARGRGHVVNLGSVAANYPYPGGNVYGATKAFVHQFSLNLRADLLGTPIRVTCVEPGLCSGTEFSVVRFAGDVDKAAAVYTGTQAITAEDVAEAVFWAVQMPAHVNVNTLELMPTCQAFAPFAIHRNPT